VTPRPLLVGEAPSKNEHPPTPIEGRIGKRLAGYAGLTFEEFLIHFDRTNLLSVRQDTKEKGFEFDAATARTNAYQLIITLERGRTVILLGKRVAMAFDVPVDYFAWRNINAFDGWLAVVPHPSGINRWFNDPANNASMTAFMHHVVERTR
jgi:hypothetical protein